MAALHKRAARSIHNALVELRGGCRMLRPWVFLLALTLAGCVQTTPAPAAAPPASPAPIESALRYAWNLTGCRELTASFDVDSAALQAKLPQGFAPGGGTSPGKTTVGIDAFSCQSASGVDGDIKDAPYASFWALATPPDALKGSAKAWYVKWDVLLADDATLRALAPLHSTTRSGHVRFSDAASVPGVGSSCEIDLDGLGAIRVTMGPYALTPASGAFALREFTTTHDPGLFLTWDATLAGSARGLTTGVAEVPGDSMAAALYGSTRIPVTIQMATSSLTNATITLNRG